MLVAQNNRQMTFTAERSLEEIVFQFFIVLINKAEGLLYNKTCLIFGGNCQILGENYENN